jgi:2-oxoisovalerate dehydrogenase E1 component
VVAEGGDITALTYGSMTQRVTAIAAEMAGSTDRTGDPVIGVEVVDLLTVDIANIDFETIGTSLAKTGQLAIFEQAAGGQSIGRRIASEVTERFFDELDGPPGVFTALDVPNPVSRVLEEEAMIDDDQIRESLRAMVEGRWK